MKSLTSLSLALFAAIAFAGGCAKPVETTEEHGHEHAPGEEHDHEHAADEGSDHGHSHDGWWCNEHGVPEEVCALCNSKIAAEFQRTGDWCDDHDRPDSQCFICHPEYEARFADQYEAKYGEKPPKPAA